MIVNADSQDVKLILNGVELTNPSGSPMVVTAADEVTLILADGTENTISDADTSGDNPQDSPSPAAPSRSIRRATGSIPTRPGRSRGQRRGPRTHHGGNGSVDTHSGLTVTGGELWAIGASGMAESPSGNSP